MNTVSFSHKDERIIRPRKYRVGALAIALGLFSLLFIYFGLFGDPEKLSSANRRAPAWLLIGGGLRIWHGGHAAPAASKCNLFESHSGRIRSL